MLRLLVAAVLLVSAGASAEERLPEVVVTAPPVRDDAPAPRDPTAFASVIETREAATTVETLTEALSNTVGVQVRRFGGLGDFSTVSVRGFSPGQVQVYLDGVPLSRADNEVVNLSDLPLDAVDHVEVYRGVTPLVFAQSAPGGVVNVVTRKAGGAPFGAASVSYGSFETRKASVAAGGSSGQVDGMIFAQYLGSAGDFDFTIPSNRYPSLDVQRTRENNAFDQGDVTARLAYRADPVTLAITTESFVKSQGVPADARVPSSTGHLDTQRNLAHLDLTTAPSGPWSIGLDGSLFGVFQQGTFTAEGPPDLGFPERTDVTSTATTVGGQVVGRGAIGTHQVPGLMVASTVERFVQSNAVETSRVRAGTSPAETRTRVALAGQDEVLLLGDRLSIVPNLRWELVHDDFPGDPRVKDPTLRVSGTRSQDFWTPRLGVRGDVGWGATLLGNVGRSARVPNLTELFGNSGVVAGNPHLKAETATSWDAGFRLRSPWINATLTDATLEYAYFSSDLDDVIVLVPSSVSVFTPKNIGAATIRGHEVAGRIGLVDRVLVTTNYTHQDARDATDDPNYRGNQLPNRPADEAYARVELSWSPARPLPLSALARLWPGRIYYDVDLIADNFLNRANTPAQHVASRVYHGLGVDVTLPWAGLHLAWEWKNFTNDQTEDALGFPLPGRSTFVTLSYGFGAGGKSTP